MENSGIRISTKAQCPPEKIISKDQAEMDPADMEDVEDVEEEETGEDENSKGERCKCIPSTADDSMTSHSVSVLSYLAVPPVLSTARQLTVQMMQNPQILAALQERLDGLNGSPSGYMESEAICKQLFDQRVECLAVTGSLATHVPGARHQAGAFNASHCRATQLWL
ncbi:unnamed protein product [Menidia menidia]|uniref:(Atlantic silverside) hypothetical protein n=1 Tax=Menidia menidia TaxID=238744 RepID=A0A8S4B2T4_9TELE|nr:unnamed protein product [Menidia menidia]